jgi:hypothetical protein
LNSQSGGTSRHRKKNQFDLVYAFAEKDKTIEKISLSEFFCIGFTHPIPNLMIDVVKYLTGYDMFKVKPRIMKTPSFDHYDGELIKLKSEIGLINYHCLVAGFQKVSRILLFHSYEPTQKLFLKISGI